MSEAVPYTLTNDSVTVVWEGQPRVVQRGSPHFKGLRDAIINEQWDKVPEHLTIQKSLKEWAKGNFVISDDGRKFLYKGKEVPSNLNTRIIRMATEGEDPTSLFNFYERLQNNPSYRSVQQLFGFLLQEGIPITEDGCFLAYKSVRNDYKDHHSGLFDNSPGRTNSMDRNKISDDPEVACDEGFHVGALEYARDVMPSGRMVVCKVDPADVVCVPKDYSMKKVRVCKYEVLGNHNGRYLPGTSISNQDIEIDEEQDNPYEDGSQDLDDDVEEEVNETLSGEEKPKKEKAKKNDPLPRKKHKYDAYPMEKLMEEPIGDLRKYAANFLRIVGASKIPGGKTVLVSRLLNVRGATDAKK